MQNWRCCPDLIIFHSMSTVQEFKVQSKIEFGRRIHDLSAEAGDAAIAAASTFSLQSAAPPIEVFDLLATNDLWLYSCY